MAVRGNHRGGARRPLADDPALVDAMSRAASDLARLDGVAAVVSPYAEAADRKAVLLLVGLKRGLAHRP
jgi:hypothetical protein